MSAQYLSDADYANLFANDYRVTLNPGDRAADVVPDVENWLLDNGQEHRSAWLISVEVERLAAQIAEPTPTPEQVQFQADVREGFGDQQVQVPDTLAEYARVRSEQFGMGQPGVIEFLGGGR